MITEEIREELFRMKDDRYRDFQAKLIPTISAESIVGVRTPELRRYAKLLKNRKDIAVFLHDLPHSTFDENQLHAFILSGMKDFGVCLREVSRFLPYVDNWATCDQLSPTVFRKHKAELLDSVRIWLDAEETYTVRFAIGMLMQYFLDEQFEPAFLEMVASVRSEEYYIRMMVAWYFATALAKQYDAALPYLEARRLDDWTHLKTIQKAVESYRIGAEQKEYLKSLRGQEKHES